MSDRTVELAVAAELEADFDKHQHLLPGRELSRRPSDDGTQTIVTMAVPGAPDGAAAMSPWFTTTGGHVELSGIDYYDAAGYRITT